MSAPAANLLRYSDVRQWAALSEHTLDTIVAQGSLGGAPLVPGGHRFYLREVCRCVLFNAPLPSFPFGVEPEPELLRVADVLAWTGLTERQWRWLERHGLTLGRPLTPHGKLYYPKATIRTRCFHPLLPAGWGGHVPYRATIHA